MRKRWSTFHAWLRTGESSAFYSYFQFCSHHTPVPVLHAFLGPRSFCPVLWSRSQFVVLIVLFSLPWAMLHSKEPLPRSRCRRLQNCFVYSLSHFGPDRKS